MAKYCSACQKQLSFRDSFEWEGNPICKSCLNEVREKGAPSDTVEPQKEPMKLEKQPEHLLLRLYAVLLSR